MPTVNPVSWISWPFEVFSSPPKKQEAPIDRLASLEVDSKESVISASFMEFLEEYEIEIFPHYEKHEAIFDQTRIHSRMHVARSLIFCEVMARFYTQLGIEVNFPLLRRAIGLHDAGRQDNGEDIWEKDSANILAKHLQKKGMASGTAKSAADIIVKDGEQKKYPIEYCLAQSGDCLDIMRLPMGPGAKNGFRKEFLTFINHVGNFSMSKEKQEVIRDQLIEEVWTFVQETERLKFSAKFSTSQGFMRNLLQHIDKEKHPLLSVVLAKEKYQFSLPSLPSLPSFSYTYRLIANIPTKLLRGIAWVCLFPFHLLEALLKKAFQCMVQCVCNRKLLTH